MGLGDAKRELIREFHGELPRRGQKGCAILRRMLVLEGASYEDDAQLAERAAKSGAFDDGRWLLYMMTSRLQDRRRSFFGQRGRG